MRTRFLYLFILPLAALLVWSCDDKSSADDTNNSTNVPTGYARVTGHVFDHSGTALSGAVISYSYELDIETTIERRAAPGALDTVELNSFEGIGYDSEIRLFWSTASESNADYFEILRDGAAVAHVEATNSATGANYTWTDSDVVNGVEYDYFLNVVDLDGSRFELGGVTVSAEPDSAIITENALHQNYPNPVISMTTIMVDLVNANNVLLTVEARGGEYLATVAFGPMAAGRHFVDFDATDLPNGFYDIHLMVAEFDTTVTMLINAPAGMAGAVAATDSTGEYITDIPIGNTIQVVDGSANRLGQAVLQDVRVMAVKQGYQPNDSLISLQNQELRTLNFMLAP